MDIAGIINTSVSVAGFFLNVVQAIRDARSKTNDQSLAKKNQQTQDELRRLEMVRQSVLHQEKLALQQRRFEGEGELQKWLASYSRETLLFAASALNLQFEEERELQRELAIYNRNTLLQIAGEQRHLALARAEANKLFDNWPLKLVPTQILGRHQNTGTIPLTIFLVPPEVAFDRFRDINSSNSPIKEKSLTTGLKRFLDTYYSSINPIRPTEFFDGAWVSNRYHGGSSITALYSMLKTEPVLILEMGIEGDNFDLRVGYWGYGQEKPWYRVVGSSFSFQPLLNEDPQIVSAALVKILCFVASWFADVHHLIYAKYPEDIVPLLPKLLPSLMSEELTRQSLEPIIPDFISYYQAVFDALKSEQPYLIPILSLQLAESLSLLPNQSFARKYLNYSMQNWLELREISTVEEEQLLRLVLATFDTHNLDYIEMLDRCLINLGDDDSEKKLKIVYNYLRDSLFTGKVRDRYGDTLYGC